MNIPLVDLQAQYQDIKDEVNAAIQEVLEKGQYILGPHVRALEEELAAYTGNRFGIGVANGTDALVMTLKAMGIGPGHEVITSPFTFFASAEGISQVGAVPVFVDIDPVTYCMDVRKLEEKITPRTRAVIPVHIFGHPVDMEPLLEIANRYGLRVIEDACQAIGARYKGRPVGSLGHAACFSFFPTKNLGGYGDGGMVVTQDEKLYEKIRMLRVHGSHKKYHHSMTGYNSRLDELQAAILRVKFRHLEDWTEGRRNGAKRYRTLLKKVKLNLPGEMESCRHVYHLFVVGTERRDDLMTHLRENGVGTGIYYPVPLHLQKVYEGMGFKTGDYPAAEEACTQTLALPLYAEMTDEQAAYIAEVLQDFFRQ